MDLDLEGLYEDDGEAYDTPCQLNASISPDVQHHSAPVLQTLSLQDEYKIHNSAPNLENDVNQCNIPADTLDYRPHHNVTHHNGPYYHNGNNMSNGMWEYCEEEIYMNTSLHAEQKFSSRNNSARQISGSQASVCKGSVTVRVEDMMKISEAAAQSPEEYYMAPAAINNNTMDFFDFPVDDQSKSEQYSPGFYDAPPPISKNHATLPPLPPSAMDPLVSFYKHNTPINGVTHSESGECFYEGINDTDITSLYDEDNFYEGLETPNDFYEGIEDSDMNDFYEGIPDDNDVFYEGLGEPQEINDVNEDASLQCLIDSLTKADTPYVPPKPPPVPMRNPSKNFKPLPNIPQNQPLDSFPVIKLPSVKKSPSLQGLPYNYIPLSQDPYNAIPKSKSLMDVTSSHRFSTSPKESSITSLSSDGLYDGIDMASDSGELERSDGRDDDGIRRSYSLNVKRTVRKTKLKTALHFEQWKESIAHTFQERRTKWKGSKTRYDIRSVLKETKTKASELVVNTETIYNTGIAALQRRTTKSRRRSRAEPPSESERSQLQETSIELDGTYSRSQEFKSIAPVRESSEEFAASASTPISSKYYDIENSESDHRLSMTSESRGRVQSMHSTVSSGEQSGAESHVPFEQSLQEEGYSKMESHYNAAAAVGGLLYLSDRGNEPHIMPYEGVPRPGAGSINTHASYTVTERHRALQQILDHEYRYIMSLKDLMKVYATPLQHTQNHKALLEPSKAQDIFFRIPEITVYHEFFYEQLRRRSMTWSRHQSLGDILLQLFHKPGLFSAYASYTDNFNHAMEIVRDTRTARPAFSKLLDKLRNKSNQMSLEDLMLLPVDHIPVYLKLLKELIKQTTQDDPDYTYLLLAKDEVEKLIEKLTERKHQADKSFSVKLLEKKISGLPNSLIAPQRYIVREERIRELDIMTDRSDERQLIVMSDLLLCLRPLTRSSNSVISTSTPSEYQYLWDCLITDVIVNNESNESKSPAVQDDNREESEGYQALKDDLLILEQVDSLRTQLKGSYSALRFDKLAEVQERLRREIAERQSSEESRRGKTLDVIRPINSPCTSTQFHRFLFSSVAKRSKWCEEFVRRQSMMQHTKDLDWCQVGEEEVIQHDRLAILLPVIKHMTPIGLTTPSQFSVECAAANADFTCPVTQDILHRIMSTGDKYDKYANVRDNEEIPLLPPGEAPEQDTPVYDENLTNHPAANPHDFLPAGDLPPLRQVPAVPRIIALQSRSPFAVNNTDTTPNNTDTTHLPSNITTAVRSQSYDSALLPSYEGRENCGAPPPLPGNHPLMNSMVQRKSDRQSIIELIESVPKEFNIDDKDSGDDNLYETPYEISLLRAEKRKLLRSLSVGDNVLGSSRKDISQIKHATLPHSTGETERTTTTTGEQPETELPSIELSVNIPEDLKNLPPDAIVSPLSHFSHMNVAEFPYESFNLELTESGELSSFIAPLQRESLATPAKPSESLTGAPLLVDKYGQVYTDKITSLISGPTSGVPQIPETQLAEFHLSVDESLLELDSEDEDDTPNLYDSQLDLTALTRGANEGSLDSYSTQTPGTSSIEATPVGLPQIQVAASEIIAEQTPITDSVYENVASSTQKLRTKVIRRESSKRSMSRGPTLTRSQLSLGSDEWFDQDPYENVNEDEGEFELKPTDVFLCGHGQSGNGEIVVLRLTEPTPHISLNIALTGSQVLCCHMVPGKQNTLWVGTQDARLLVYQMTDPSSTLLELELEGGPVICISHIEDSVFVGTSEGYIHVFTRDASVNEWCDNDPVSKKLGNGSICTILPIGGNMWCSCGCQIFVISPENVTVEHLFSTHNNTSAQVYKMVNSGSGVWLAIRNSPVIRLFHAKTGEHLEDYDISTVVHHLFTGSQSAARRRRSENVRVTALLASSSTGALWIGTSSGVIVVVPISKPPVAPKICGPPFLSYMGHYDGVRFLVQAQSRIRKYIASESTEQEHVYEEITSQVVISCGKGMEDFRDHSTGLGDRSSQIQSSSYLIVWHYPVADDAT